MQMTIGAWVGQVKLDRISIKRPEVNQLWFLNLFALVMIEYILEVVKILSLQLKFWQWGKPKMDIGKTSVCVVAQLRDKVIPACVELHQMPNFCLHLTSLRITVLTPSMPFEQPT